jgi:hypothetical protein
VKRNDDLGGANRVSRDGDDFGELGNLGRGAALMLEPNQPAFKTTQREAELQNMAPP